MKLSRAISIASRWMEGHVVTLREGEAREYHKLCHEALKLMREQEKRSVGCKYCREYESIVEENGDFISFDATLSKGIFLEACTCDVVLEAKVLFCPMCGRRLEEV